MERSEATTEAANEQRYQLEKQLAKISELQRRLLFRCLHEEKLYLETFPGSPYPYGTIVLAKSEVSAAIGLARRDLVVTSRERTSSVLAQRVRYAKGSKRTMWLLDQGRFLATKLAERFPDETGQPLPGERPTPEEVLCDANDFASAFLRLPIPDEASSDWLRCCNKARALRDAIGEALAGVGEEQRT